MNRLGNLFHLNINNPMKEWEEDLDNDKVEHAIP